MQQFNGLCDSSEISILVQDVYLQAHLKDFSKATLETHRDPKRSVFWTPIPFHYPSSPKTPSLCKNTNRPPSYDKSIS